MKATDIPKKIDMPWAMNAAAQFLRLPPDASQIGIIDGAASFNDGFPPLTFTPVGAGGVNPSGADTNGILQMITAIARWFCAGAPINYDSTFQTAIGGYPKGAVVQSATTLGVFWISTLDNNLTNPDSGGGGWTNAYSPPAGSVFAYAGSSVPAGYLQVPQTLTLVSTTTYANLFNAIGYTWGGSGASFALPYLASGYVPVQGTLAALSHGKVKDHTHPYTLYTAQAPQTGSSTPCWTGTQTVQTGTPASPEGGTDNLAAGMGMMFIVKY